MHLCGCPQQEKEEMRQREREKRRQRVQAINTLVELGFGKRDASRALHKTHGDVDRAYEVRAPDSRVHLSQISQNNSLQNTPTYYILYMYMPPLHTHTDTTKNTYFIVRFWLFDSWRLCLLARPIQL